MFYCLVVGSREFTNYKQMEINLDKFLSNQKEVTIVSGGAKGADALAEKYAAKRGYECIVFKADWKQYGKAAGIIRNEQMHKFIAQFEKRGCVAFWDGQSKGTYSNFNLAKKYNNPLRIVEFLKKERGMER